MKSYLVYFGEPVAVFWWIQLKSFFAMSLLEAWPIHFHLRHLIPFLNKYKGISFHPLKIVRDILHLAIITSTDLLRWWFNWGFNWFISETFRIDLNDLFCNFELKSNLSKFLHQSNNNIDRSYHKSFFSINKNKDI